MRHRTARRIVICLLGILLGLGMGLSAVQASGMMLRMTLAGGMDTPDDGCGGCIADAAATAVSCLSACAATVLGLPASANPLVRTTAALSCPADVCHLRGTGPPPDPHPPRPISPL